MLWEKLGNAQEAAEAYAAMQKLASSPEESVALCRAQLLPKSTQPEEIQRWIAQLDDEEFAVREQASRLLERSGIEAGRAVEKALKGDCSLEMRSRLESVQQVWEKTQPRIRTLRAAELLEQIGTAGAVDILRELEKKTGDSAIRDEVGRSLGRLKKRSVR